MMSALLDRVRNVKRETRAVAEADWTALVIDVTNGNERDPDDVAELLERAGKTVEDLEAACARLQQRREKLALYAQ